jgi:hypothetical protein
MTRCGRPRKLAELMRNAGVIELPDGSGWYGSAWERHDDPEQT